MRTTLTIDDDLADEIRARTARGKSLKEVVNTALRRGLQLDAQPDEPETPFVVQPFSSAFVPGIDPRRLNQLVDELDTEQFLARQKSREGSL